MKRRSGVEDPRKVAVSTLVAADTHLQIGSKNHKRAREWFWDRAVVLPDTLPDLNETKAKEQLDGIAEKLHLHMRPVAAQVLRLVTEQIVKGGGTTETRFAVWGTVTVLLGLSSAPIAPYLGAAAEEAGVEAVYRPLLRRKEEESIPPALLPDYKDDAYEAWRAECEADTDSDAGWTDDEDVDESEEETGIVERTEVDGAEEEGEEGEGGKEDDRGVGRGFMLVKKKKKEKKPTWVDPKVLEGIALSGVDVVEDVEAGLCSSIINALLGIESRVFRVSHVAPWRWRIDGVWSGVSCIGLGSLSIASVLHDAARIATSLGVVRCRRKQLSKLSCVARGIASGLETILLDIEKTLHSVQRQLRIESLHPHHTRAPTTLALVSRLLASLEPLTRRLLLATGNVSDDMETMVGVDEESDPEVIAHQVGLAGATPREYNASLFSHLTLALSDLMDDTGGSMDPAIPPPSSTSTSPAIQALFRAAAAAQGKTLAREEEDVEDVVERRVEVEVGDRHGGAALPSVSKSLHLLYARALTPFLRGLDAWSREGRLDVPEAKELPICSMLHALQEGHWVAALSDLDAYSGESGERTAVSREKGEKQHITDTQAAIGRIFKQEASTREQDNQARLVSRALSYRPPPGDARETIGLWVGGGVNWRVREDVERIMLGETPSGWDDDGLAFITALATSLRAPPADRPEVFLSLLPPTSPFLHRPVLLPSLLPDFLQPVSMHFQALLDSRLEVVEVEKFVADEGQSAIAPKEDVGIRATLAAQEARGRESFALAVERRLQRHIGRDSEREGRSGKVVSEKEVEDDTVVEVRDRARRFLPLASTYIKRLARGVYNPWAGANTLPHTLQSLATSCAFPGAAMAIQHAIRQELLAQAMVTAQSISKLLLSHQLLGHLRLLRGVLLADRPTLLTDFVEALSTHFESNSFLPSAAEMTLWLHSSVEQHGTGEVVELVKHLAIVLEEECDAEDPRSPLSRLQVTYHTPWPIQRVLDEDTLRVYGAAFRLVVQGAVTRASLLAVHAGARAHLEEWERIRGEGVGSVWEQFVAEHPMRKRLMCAKLQGALSVVLAIQSIVTSGGGGIGEVERLAHKMSDAEGIAAIRAVHLSSLADAARRCLLDSTQLHARKAVWMMLGRALQVGYAVRFARQTELSALRAGVSSGLKAAERATRAASNLERSVARSIALLRKRRSGAGWDRLSALVTAVDFNHYFSSKP